MLSAPRVAWEVGPSTVNGDLDFTALRAREFARLDAHGLAYLDYAATALYGTSQLSAHHTALANGVFGNPHSESTPSRRSTAVIERARPPAPSTLRSSRGSSPTRTTTGPRSSSRAGSARGAPGCA